MQRIIQINIAGRIIPVEEDAYAVLKDYITSLERSFSGDEGREIVADIENRIAELFSSRLQTGAPAIDRADVRKVMETLGAANDMGGNAGPAKSSQGFGKSSYTHQQQAFTPPSMPRSRRLYRDPYDKVAGGVCSGLGHYFDVDPVILRLILAVLILCFGIGILAYLIAWAVIPAASSKEELYGTQGPMTVHDIGRNMEAELNDLKRRGEQMSRELKDFFSRQKP